MQVTFFVCDDRKHICGWEALLGARRRVPGSIMGYGNDVPHDLVQYVVEAATGCEHGFWGLVARGATFKSTGRKRTKPGRALIAQHRRELVASEQLAGAHVAQWRTGAQSPVTAALDRAREQWNRMTMGDELTFRWPSPHGEIRARATTREIRS